ncbi:hypothetical protein [Amycolatopsis sp. FDAARGOS 1241]|uniref:hypothetical protein n=1 Tax=Amycolatopsis sp. FDAARGOS 1241 TaxID=2778070 RepID=UPI00194F3D0A|nr:hypothetical protein [Amycolatopsis sp. FDAARGOS 1241]QRP49089.1 hypothetical protein I6J71_15605 [Amycolatopsis sp. FDAARGOS 1241]
MAEEDTSGRFERWVDTVKTIIAPASLITALLFHFGYVSTRAQYEYFGIGCVGAWCRPHRSGPRA